MATAKRIRRDVIANAVGNDDSANGSRGKRSRGKPPVTLDLPGGSALLDSSKAAASATNVVGRNIGALPRELTYDIRAYLDVLFGAVETERLRLSRQQCYRSDMTLPNVVASVLRYNNIAFKTVKLTNTRIPLPEPVWYDIDLVNNELHLYLYQPMYDAFCTNLMQLPVVVSSGVIKLEDYNPVETHPLTARDNFDTASFICAIVADHVAQHIITDVLRGDRKIPGADIHDRYNDVGTTLHSMLEITITGVQDSSRTTNATDAVSYFTLLGDVGKSASNTAADFPFTYATT